MQRSLTRPLGTWGATNVRFLFGFPFSVVFFAVVLIATGDRVPWPTVAFWPWLMLGALSQIVATGLMLLAMNDRSLRRDDGLSEDRGDPDRDLRLHLPRRSSHRAEGDCDPDRHHRRRHHRVAAGRRKEFCGIEADHHWPGGSRRLRAVGDRLSRRDHHRPRRLLRDGGVLHAGVRPVRADAGADDLSAGARARCTQGHPRPVETVDAGGLHRRIRLAILVSGVCAHRRGERTHAGAGRGAVRAGGGVLLVQAAAVGA